MKSRRTKISVSIDGVDITSYLDPHLLSLVYTDSSDGEADDLRISLEDASGDWLENWLDAAVQGTADSGVSEKGTMTVTASITRVNAVDGKETEETLECGTFTMDCIEASGPPKEVDIECTALPYSSDIRQVVCSKAWEGYSLQGVASEIAGTAGLSLVYEATSNPQKDRWEQAEQSDIAFLMDICGDEGICVKVADGQLILYDEMAYEAQSPAAAIYKSGNGTGRVISWRFRTGQSDTQYGACTVTYYDPVKQDTFTYTYTDPEDEDGRTLYVRSKVESSGEAAELAEKLLRRKNKYEYQGTLTVPGDPNLCAGITVQLPDYGSFSGKWYVKTATHKVSSAGYTTVLDIRKCLEGY